MPTPNRTLLPFVLAAWITAIPTAASAAPQRTFVASTGSDANPCSLAFPCRTFVAAVAVAAAGGEVVALDSAGYGAVTINKAITIAGPPGVQASITASSGSGVSIGAGASDRVVLRGLDIITMGTAVNGIAVSAAGDVVIEDCLISGTADYGIGYVGPGRLTISRSRIQAAFNQTAIGIFGGAGEARFALEDSRVEADGNGSGTALIAVDTVNGTIRDSQLLGSPSRGSYGVRLQGSSGKQAAVTIQRSLVSGHAYGVYADAQSAGFVANASVVNSDVSHNQFGIWATSAGTIALSGTHVGHNDIGATATSAGVVFTDGRNFFGYNLMDLNLSTTLFGPVGVM